jgi:hypothetical protein
MPFFGVGSGKTRGARLEPISFAAIAPKWSAIKNILSIFPNYKNIIA